MPLTKLQDLLDRVSSYSPVEVAFELAIIAIVIWAVVRFVQGTRAAGALKGLLLIFIVATVIVRVFGGGDSFARVSYLYELFVALAAVALIVIFQPELHRALIRLGETPLLRANSTESVQVVDAIASSCSYLAKQRFGAIIVIEHQFGLRGLTEGGTTLNADLTERLMSTIFYPGSACTTWRWWCGARRSSRRACNSRSPTRARCRTRTWARGTGRRWGSRRSRTRLSSWSARRRARSGWRIVGV